MEGGRGEVDEVNFHHMVVLNNVSFRSVEHSFERAVFL